jgi:hypothetical protein
MKFKKGDTLSAIAKKNGTTVAKMLAANPNIKSANSIQAGQSFMLPPELSKNSGKYTGRNETNPFKGTDLKALDADQASKKKKTNNNKKLADSILKTLKKKKTNNGGDSVAEGAMPNKKTIPMYSNDTAKKKTSKISFSNDQAIKSKNKMVSKNTSGGIDEAKGDNSKLKRKSKSNISGSSSYDSDFTKSGLEKRGLSPKANMSKSNYDKTTSEKNKKLAKKKMKKSGMMT